MNNRQTIAAFARETVEDLFALRQEELERILDLDLPDSAFLSSARGDDCVVPVRFDCKIKPRITPALSGLKPQIYISSELDGVEAKAAAAKALWTLTRTLYERGDDARADLSAWIAAGLVFDLRIVSSRFLESYETDSNMLRIGPSATILALATFEPLRKLVL